MFYFWICRNCRQGAGRQTMAGSYEPPTRGARGGVRPDIMILKGWLETSPPPQGPSKTYVRGPQTYVRGPQTYVRGPQTYVRGPRDDMMRADKSKMKADESRRVTIIIGELGFSSDLGFQKTVDRKQHKYAPLTHRRTRERGLER